MEGYYFYTQLIQMGLTPKLIAKFIDPPDRETLNPKNPRWSSMKMYDKSRVWEIIKSDAFMKEFVPLDDKRIRRKQAKARQAI